MAPRVLVTGSAQGLGRAAALDLLEQGHDVVVHARDEHRAQSVADLAARGATVVVADLSDLEQVRTLAGQVQDVGPVDAVIHNAGVYGDARRDSGLQGHPRTLTVNVLAPYLLTCLLPAPQRLVFLTSDMHRSGSTDLDDVGWTVRRWDSTQAYCDSKLLVTALALALARRWLGVVTSAVDPGWVPTRMGGPGAPDDLAEGHRTQVWLAVSDDPGASRSGGVWHHHRPTRVAAAASDHYFQDRLLDRLAALTGFRLPGGGGAH